MHRIVAAIGAAVLVSLPAVPASAQVSLCGTTVRGAVLLQGDLDCDLSVGTGADIDLGGHAVNGTIRADGEAEGGVEDVVIRNGSVDSMHLIDADVALADLVVEGSITSRLGSLEADRVDTSFTLEDAQPGSDDWPGSDVTFRDGRIRGISRCSDCGNSSFDISRSQLDAISAHNLDLSISDSVIAGLDVDGPSDIEYYGDWISVDLSGNRITGDVDLGAVSSARLLSNQVEGAQTRVTGYRFTLDIRGNRFRGSESTGLSIGWEQADYGQRVFGTVSGNRFVGHRFDGLAVRLTDIFTADLVVRDNVAIDNGGYGMAVEGAVDGGGNRTSRNGATEQCVGVVCAPK